MNEIDITLPSMPWRRKWQPAPVCLPGKSHGQRSLVGYSPLGHKELDKAVYCHPVYLTYMQSVCMHDKLLQSCLILCDPLEYSQPGSSVHGILQARILEWVAVSFSMYIYSFICLCLVLDAARGIFHFCRSTQDL